jgi:hypothetical protein
MERRTLLSASPQLLLQDVATLKAALAHAKADLVTNVGAAGADLKAVKKAIGTAELTVAQEKLLATLQRDERTGIAKVKKDVQKPLSAGGRGAKQLGALVRKLQANPNSAAVQAKLAAAVATLQTAISANVVQVTQSDASNGVNVVDTDLDAIASAVPETQAAVALAKSHLAGSLQTLATDAGSIEAAVTTLAADSA